MSDQYPGYVLVIERTFDAPAEEVFDAWTSEEVLRRWFYADPELETPTAEVDLRVGGRLRIVMRDPKAARTTAPAASTRWWTRRTASPSPGPGTTMTPSGS